MVSFYTSHLTSSTRAFSCYFGVTNIVICAAHSPARLCRIEECVFVCIGRGVGVKGAPWGEAGQPLPVAALGQGMAVQDTRFGSWPDLMIAVFNLCPKVLS
ncbi:hypothetical protein AMECASPLE_025450 [Ameca splendens]|uniref:Uncharacterized protein n=1 Tax=Ameca splendens TaxID=208324 RepID=A0ABV0YGU3_9TELE